MLTLFEYLRKRAYEAVMCGINDAIETVEAEDSDRSDAEIKHSPTGLGSIRRFGAEQSPPSHSGNAGADTPPPRKRGRPPKGGKRP